MSLGQSSNVFIATLAQPLSAGGSETETYLSTITTLTGEELSTSVFSIFGKGTITIDPLSTTSVEFGSFTAVDQTNLGFSGLVRGLSAFDYTSSTSRAKYHPVGTQVIISFGVHNLLDLVTYVNGILSGSVGNASASASGVAYLSSVATASKPRALSSLVSQTATPGMTLNVASFALADQTYAGGTTSTYTAPVSNPRIDLLCYNVGTAALAYRTGTEGSSPSTPSPQVGDIVLASIYHTVGETSIKDNSDATNGYIYAWYYPSVYEGGTPAGTIISSAARVTPTGYLLCNGAAVSRSTYANLLSAICPSQTCTISNNSPALVTATAHGLVAGDQVHFTSTGSLPSGLSVATTYYVISTGLTANAFELAFSPAGSAINTSTNGSGTHTVFKSAWGMGDGSSTFNVPDLRGKNILGMGATTNISLAFDTTCVGTNTIAVPDASFPAQGQAIKLTGTVPTGLVAATTYYVQRVSSTSIKLASTQALANEANADLTFTSSGMSGVCQITYATTARTILGKMAGEETHALAVTEIASHVHTIPSSVGVGSTSTAVTGTTGSGQNTGSVGSDAQHNIFSPYALGNIFIKY